MGTLSDYFEKRTPKPVWYIGDRVFGYWNKIPFIGTVGNDSIVSELEGPRVSVFLDLPIMYEGQLRSIVIVGQQDLKPLKVFEQ